METNIVSEEQSQLNESNEAAQASASIASNPQSIEGSSPPSGTTDLAKTAKEHYGFSDEQINSFTNEADLSNAMLNYDQQLLQQPQQVQPSTFPANPNEQTQMQMPVQPQQPQYQNPPQQVQPQEQVVPDFPELDPEMMDETQFQAFTALQSQYQKMSGMLNQMNDQWQAYETHNYVSQFQPSIDKTGDSRFNEQNPNYAQNMYQLLDTVERLNQGRSVRGLPLLPTEDAVEAAYRNFKQINGPGVESPNPLIGQPSTTRSVESSGDAKALRTIESFGFGGGEDASGLLSGFPD